MVPRGKPFPDIYTEALRRIGCEDASRSIVVEDAVNGIKAAKAAGAFAVGITNSGDVLLRCTDLGRNEININHVAAVHDGSANVPLLQSLGTSSKATQIS